MFKGIFYGADFIVFVIQVRTIPSDIFLKQIKIFISISRKIKNTTTENKKLKSKIIFFSTLTNIDIIHLLTTIRDVISRKKMR